MDESQIRAALFVWLERESARNGGVFTRRELETVVSIGDEMDAVVKPTAPPSYK